MNRKTAIGLIAGAPLSAAALTRAAAADDVLRIGSIAQPNTLNPLQASLQIEQFLYSGIFSGLVTFDDRTQIVPDLALAVPSKHNGGISRDGKTITYALQPNATWHDGVAVTAADVVFSFARFMDPAVSFPARSTYEFVDRVEAHGAHTVVVHLKEANPDAVKVLFVNGYQGSIVPKHVLEGTVDWHKAAFNGMPVGSGPYAVVRWERGSQLVLRSFSGYYGGAPPIARIDVKFVPDANTLTIGMKSGATDLVYEAPPGSLPMLNGATHLKVMSVPADSLHWLIVNTAMKPVDDARVRQALALAVDRSAIIANVLQNFGRLASDLVPPWSPYSTPHAGDDRPDPAGARALLDAAGWKLASNGIRTKDGQPLSLDITTVAGSQTRQAMAVVLQSAWKAIGIEVGVRSFPINALVAPDGVFPQGRFQVGLAGYQFRPVADRQLFYAAEAIPPNGFNYARYKNPAIDRLIAQAARTPDGPQRAALYHAIAAIAARDLPYIPIAWFTNAYVVSDVLSGLRPGPDTGLFWNAPEWKLRR